jgi:RNA polymerase sigma factor (sigma-70 family)
LPVTIKKDNPPHADHAQYVETFRAGNNVPLGAVYLDLQASFVKRFGGLGLKMKDGQDCFQAAIEAMLINFSKPEFELTCPLEAYLTFIFRNKVREYFRKNKREGVRFEETPDLGAEDPDHLILAEQAEREAKWHLLLRRTHDTLEGRCRAIFDLINQEVPAKLIANRLKMKNANTVYQARRRCRNAWERAIRKDTSFKTCKPDQW